ncbi:MAG: ADP-ribose pyrophosphatase YjhB (NUDIX family) [Myxococcota bacterium]|jgi:ADP-ribose pyrophosphatase YjhB (NUDIX family)
MHRPHDFCPYCGAALARTDWPRTCTGCARISYLNPAPVVVLLQPVDDGLLVVRRGIGPGRGLLALPGGFIDFGETWQEGCARELLEETGVVVDPADVVLEGVESTGQHVLVFGRGPVLSGATLPAFVANAECTERAVIFEAVELAFALHTEAAVRWFGGAIR